MGWIKEFFFLGFLLLIPLFLQNIHCFLRLNFPWSFVLKVSVNKKTHISLATKRADGLHYPTGTPFYLLSRKALHMLLEYSHRFLVQNCNKQESCSYHAEEWARYLSVLLISISSVCCIWYWLGTGSFPPQWQVHHHLSVTLASRDDAAFVLRQAHLGMFGSELIDMIILNVSA